MPAGCFPGWPLFFLHRDWPSLSCGVWLGWGSGARQPEFPCLLWRRWWEDLGLFCSLPDWKWGREGSHLPPHPHPFRTTYTSVLYQSVHRNFLDSVCLGLSIIFPFSGLSVLSIKLLTDAGAMAQRLEHRLEDLSWIPKTHINDGSRPPITPLPVELMPFSPQRVTVKA